MIVERELAPTPLPDEERPFVIATQRARLSCGCAVWVGRRDDDQLATVCDPCSLEHRRTIIRRFNAAMVDVLPSQSTVPLIDVVAEKLMASA